MHELEMVMAESWEYLELAGCSQPISSLEEKEALVENLVNFRMITRMQLPLQRYRENTSPCIINSSMTSLLHQP